MAFIQETKQEGKKLTSNFIKLVQNMPVIVQVIDETAQVKFQHWIKDSSGKPVAVKCLGYGKCPVDLFNASLGSNAKNDLKYIKFNKRYMVNVVDLTLAKKGQDGMWYYPSTNSEGQLSFPERDSLGNVLTAVVPEPVNEVKILERGPKLFEEELKVLDEIVTNDTGERVGITHFPVKLITTGTGRDTSIKAIHMLNSPLTVNPADYQEKRFDLDAGFSLEAEEIQALLDGTPLSDILSARKAVEQLA